MHPVTRMSLSTRHLMGLDDKPKKKAKLTDEQKTIKRLKKQLTEVDRKVHRLLAEAKARQEFPIEISKETYELYQKNMVKNENLLTYALRKALEVELLKEQLAAHSECIPTCELSSLGWMVGINGEYQYFRYYEQAAAERKEFEDSDPDFPEEDRELPREAFVRK